MPSKRSPCCASRWSRRRASWSTSITSAATRRSHRPEGAGAAAGRFYKATVALVRAYANIADELEPAGYSEADIGRIKQQLDQYLNVREIIRKASGETLDLKPTRPTCGT